MISCALSTEKQISAEAEFKEQKDSFVYEGAVLRC